MQGVGLGVRVGVGGGRGGGVKFFNKYLISIHFHRDNNTEEKALL